MRSIILLLILIAPLCRESVAQDILMPGEPGDVMMDAAKLEAAAELFRVTVEEDNIRGAVVLVAREGRIVLLRAYGWRDRDGELPMETDTQFRMASNSKVVTAAAIMALADRGQLELDELVHETFASFNHGEAAEVTLRHLLTHTSGLAVPGLFVYPIQQASEDYPDAPSLLFEVGRIGEVGTKRAPGIEFEYCNAGYNTLAGVVEQKTGSYKAFLHDTFYEPLGMANSFNHEPDADASRMSTVFRGYVDGRWRVGWQPGDAPDLPFVRGSGGMISTAEDYAIFLQMLLNGGSYNGQRVLTEAMVAQCTNDQSAFIEASDRYGLGLVIEGDGICSHGGSDGTWAWIDQRRNLIGCVLTQTQSGRSSGNPRIQFRELVNDACVDVPN